MKQEVTKIRSIFIHRGALEEWLCEMAEEGWIVKDFSYIFFASFLFFGFEKQPERGGSFCLYDLKYEQDEEIFQSFGWQRLQECEGTIIFYHEQKNAPLPLLDLKRYSVRRFVKSLSNLAFLSAVLFALRMDAEVPRQQFLFGAAFLLFSLPRLYDVKSTKRGSNLTKLLKNIVLAALVAFITTLLVETAIAAFSALR